MKTLLKVVGALVALLLVVAIGGYAWARSTSSAIMAKHYETHKVDFPIPFPLTDAEIAQLRAERTPKPAPDAVPTAATPPADGAAAPAPPPDPLAGVDLKAIAQERAVASGKHLIESRFACIECHGKDLGGGTMVDSPPVGRMFGVNLTSGKGGQVANYKAADWDRIVRHGVLPDGRPAMMPASDFFGMSDHELSDVISYIRTIPPVDKEVPRPTLGPVFMVLLASGKVPSSAEMKGDHQKAHPVEPPATDVTVEFGKHMMQVCTGCHTESLAGGPIEAGPPDWPPAANLTPHAEGLAGWKYEDFAKAMKDGKRKDGTPLRVPMKAMAQYAANLSETELKAMWMYLQSVPPKPSRH